MALSAPERAKFTAGQLAELDRMADATLEGVYLSDSEGVPLGPVEREAVLDSWVPKSNDQLRGRVNILSTSQSVINYSADTDYTEFEAQDLNDLWIGQIARNIDNIPTLLNTRSAWGGASNRTVGPQQAGIDTSYTVINQWDHVGDLKNCRVVGNTIVVDVAGFYSARYHMAFTGSNNTTFTVAIHANDVELVDSKEGDRLDTASDVGHVSGFVQGPLNAGSVIDMRVLSSAAGGANFTLQTGNFEITRIR